jgi:hypothetical protein
MTPVFWFCLEHSDSLLKSIIDSTPRHKKDKNSKQLRMIFSNCALLTMTLGMYFTNHGSVKSNDSNDLDQGNVSV